MGVHEDISRTIYDLEGSIEIYHHIDSTIANLESTKALKVNRYNSGENILDKRNTPTLVLSPISSEESLPVKYARFNCALSLAEQLSRAKDGCYIDGIKVDSLLVYDWEKTGDLTITPKYIITVEGNTDLPHLYQDAVKYFWHIMDHESKDYSIRLRREERGANNSFDHWRMLNTPGYPYIGPGAFADVYYFAEELEKESKRSWPETNGRYVKLMRALVEILEGDKKAGDIFSKEIAAVNRSIKKYGPRK